MSARSDARHAGQDYADTMWAATQAADDARERLAPAEHDDDEERHDCQPNAPWAGWFWTAVWAVIAAAAVGIWLAPWLADKAIP